MPSWPLGVPELSSELGRRRRKSFRLVLLLRLSVCAGAGMWNPSRLNTVLPAPRTDWRLTFNFRSDSPLVPSGGCFHPCASKCATWTRASSTTLPWMSCRWTPNATGVCVCVCDMDQSHYSPIGLFTSARTLPAGTCTTALSGWWRGTRTTRASPRASTCTRTLRARGRRGCVRSSALTGSSSPTTRWTTRDM